MRRRFLSIAFLTLLQMGLEADEISKLKDLHIDTVLADAGQPKAIVVTPPAKEYAAIANTIRSRIRELAGAELPVKNPAQLTEDDFSKFNLIVLGNVPDNELVRKLYRERWVLDSWYPGDETFVVRSVHNPYGHGKNIIFIGGENPTFVQLAAQRFLGMLKVSDPLAIGWIMTFETDQRGAPLSEEMIQQQAKRADEMLSFKNGRRLISSAAKAAQSYYSTGQEGWAKVFTMFVKKHKEIGAPGMGTHMNVYHTISMWDLIEESPVFSDEDRLLVTNHLLYIMRSKEGAHHSFFRKGTKQFGVRHNHQTLPGLACLFGGRYFKRGYNLAEAEEWIEAAKKLFDAQKISSKPQCDCNSYEWGTLHQTGWWSLASGDYTFFENDCCRAAANRALLELDNRGISAPHGDFGSIVYFPRTLLLQAAEFYKDGRYEWAIRKYYSNVRASSAPERTGAANLVRGIEPKGPADLLGIKAAPMSPHFYKARETTMPLEPEPNIPLQQSFDKISFRRTFNPEDQYLLLDGIGRGSHGHIDVNGVSHFTDNSRAWLIDMCYAEGPNMRDHNVVTVMRNGESPPPPPLAALDAIADLETLGFCKTSVPNYNGLRWNRNIFWAKERYFLFVDQLVAIDPADYTMRCYWRTLGDGRLSGAIFTSRQQKREVGQPVKQITREDADDGKCVKFIHPQAALRKKLNLDKGEWKITIFGCGHHPGDDSFFVDVDGERIGHVGLSREQIAPTEPICFPLRAGGEHEIKLSLREAPGTICDKITLTGPAGEEMTIDGLALEIPPAPRPRMDEFTLVCVGVDKCSLTRDSENFGKWWKQYGYADPIVNILQQSTSREMNRGDRHCFANLFFVSNEDHPIELDMRELADGVVLVKDAEKIACAGVGPTSFKLGDAQVNIEGQQFVLTPDTLAVLNATSVSWHGALLAEEKPTSIEKEIKDDRPARATDLQKAWQEAGGRAPVPAARRRVAARPLTPEWSFNAGAPVIAIAQGDLNGNRQSEIALGCQDNKVRVLNSLGKLLWEYEAGGKINSVAISDIDGDGKGEVIAGSDDRCCYLLESSGREQWRYQGAEGDDPYWGRYWKAGEVEKVLAADINGDGKKEVIFAAANMHIHACDVAGKLLWRFRQYGVCTSILAADVTGDGKENVIGGPAKITCYSNCHVLNAEGESISRFGNDGWASALTAICTADLDGDGPLEVICGTNMNNIYALNAPKGELAQRWKYTAGDVVNSLCVANVGDGKAQYVIAGSASEYVYALDNSGKRFWTTNVHDNVFKVGARDLNADGRDEVVAATPDAIYILDADGRVTAGFSPESHINYFDLGERILLGTQDGNVHLLRIDK